MHSRGSPQLSGSRTLARGRSGSLSEAGEVSVAATHLKKKEHRRRGARSILPHVASSQLSPTAIRNQNGPYHQSSIAYAASEIHFRS